MLPEKKVYSQHGEDGIIEFLHSKLRNRNYKFIEIGCASGEENNSRNLLENGWTGICVDADSEKVAHYKQMGYDGGIYLAQPVNAKTIEGLADRFYAEPDFFSLDIDSYDYFMADWLMKHGFSPKIICVETNTFLRGTTTVEYVEPFSRYAIQPEYGLYFGASEGAWKHLFRDYHYCGMDSSFTNAFFIRDADYSAEAHPSGYQTYFCAKYGKTGEELANTLLTHPVIDVTWDAYQEAYQKVFG